MSQSNLARKISNPAPLRDEEKLRQAKVNLTAVPESDRQARLRVQEIQRANRRSQMRSFIALASLVLVLTAILGFNLGQQTKLVEINFANAEIERKIDKLKIENVQKNSELVALVDLNDVRARAFELGMLDPSAKQIVYLDVPVSDRLILGQAQQSLSAEAKQEKSAARENIEGFFKTILP